MFSHVAIENEHFLGSNKLSVTELEYLDSVRIVANLLDLRPFKVNLREFDGLLFRGCDAELIHLDETFDKVCHER